MFSYLSSVVAVKCIVYGAMVGMHIKSSLGMASRSSFGMAFMLAPYIIHLVAYNHGHRRRRPITTQASPQHVVFGKKQEESKKQEIMRGSKNQMPQRGTSASWMQGISLDLLQIPTGRVLLHTTQVMMFEPPHCLYALLLWLCSHMMPSLLMPTLLNRYFSE